MDLYNWIIVEFCDEKKNDYEFNTESSSEKSFFMEAITHISY